jgi:hypothetical protein
MDTNMAFNILVFTLGCLLGIFLILSIVVVILALRLIAALRAVVAKGEHLVDSAEAIGETLRANAGAVGIVRTLMQFMQMANKYKRKG